MKQGSGIRDEESGSELPLDLLWKAWLEGFLARRGVQTIEGWIFVAHDVIFTVSGVFNRGVEPLTRRIIHHLIN